MQVAMDGSSFLCCAGEWCGSLFTVWMFMCPVIYCRGRISATRRLRRCRHQVTHSHHVVTDHAQLHQPTDPGPAAQFGSPQQSILLAPAKAFFDALAEALTEPVTGVPRSARIDGRTALRLEVLRDLRRDAPLAQRRDEAMRVVTLVAGQRAPDLTPCLVPSGFRVRG
jgi:hypothetical protein